MSNIKPQVSVVMSVFNAERYLRESIESVLSQTFKDFELIIVNDGSTDCGLEIINRYKQQDGRIIVLSRENKGLVKSLNEAISIARGKYIARMDADDISLPHRLEIQYSYMEKNREIGVCGAGAEIFGAEIKSKKWSKALCHAEIKASLLFSTTFIHPTVFIRKSEIFDKGILYNENYKNIEDYKLWVDLLSFTKFQIIDNIVLRYRFHKKSITRLEDSNNSNERFKLTSKIHASILNQLGITNRLDESVMHYQLGLNERLANAIIDYTRLNEYLCKIEKANNSAYFFDKEQLAFILNKKFLTAIYFGLLGGRLNSWRFVFSKRALAGLFQFMRRKFL